MTLKPLAPKRTQQGAVLVVSLLVLMVVTLIVVAVNQESVVQEKMTSAVRQSSLVFQTAEAALVEAEEYVSANVTDLSLFSSSGAGGFYSENNGPSNYDDEAIWITAKTQSAVELNSGYSAMYIVESLGEVYLESADNDVGLYNNYTRPEDEAVANVFRIVVRAQGPNSTGTRIIASYYSVKFSS